MRKALKNRNALTGSTESPPSRTGSAMTMLLVCASVGLNVLLVAQLLHRRPSLPPPPAHAIADGAHKSGSPMLAGAASTPSPPAAAIAANVPPPFLWSQVESSDYRQYIANLRAVGCPEQTLRDIILADLNQLFAPRAAAIWKAEVREYWQKSRAGNANPEQMKQLMALGKEKAAIMQDLLGTRLDEQQVMDTVYLQLHGSEQNLLFLPAEKREAALQALAETEFEARSEQLRTLKGHSSELDQQLFNETLQILANVLTPAELEEYRLRGSPAAGALRNVVQHFECAPEEFRQLVDSCEQGANMSLDDLRSQAAEQVRRLFGEERAQEFERVSDRLYISARQAAEEQGIPLELADQAWQVTRDMRDAASQVAKNGGLSAAGRTRQLQVLQQNAEAQLNRLLGPKAAFGVIRDLRVVVNARPSP